MGRAAAAAAAAAALEGYGRSRMTRRGNLKAEGALHPVWDILHLKYSGKSTVEYRQGTVNRSGKEGVEETTVIYGC